MQPKHHEIYMVIFLLFFQGVLAMGNGINSPRIINFNKHQYGGANKNWAAGFDTEGYTYFANSLGLLEFDGVCWRLYDSPNGFPLRSLAVDKNNRVYTGGYRELGFWERNREGVLEYQSMTKEVEEHFPANEELWNIFIIDEKVYFQSFSSVYIYSNDSFRVANASGFITGASVAGTGLLIALKDRGIYKISDGKCVPYLQSSFFRGKTITFITPSTKPDHFILGTESSGLFEYQAATGKAKPWATSLNNKMERNNINNGTVTREGKIILGTILGGITILDKQGKESRTINYQSGLQSNTVHAISTDSLENVWVATDKGLDFISFSSPDSYSIFQREELGAVYSAALYNNYLYLGTNQGVFRGHREDLDQPFQLVPGTQRQVWDCKIIDDKLFVGHNSGTFIIDNHEVKKISDHAGAYDISRVPNRPDHLIQSTYTDLVVYTKANGKWQVSHAIDGFSDLIRFIEFDHRGNLWASHLYHGIYKIKLNNNLDSAEHVSRYGHDSGLWKKGISSRAFKIENRIVFSNKEKLYTYDDLNDTIIPYHFLNKNLGEYAKASRIARAPGNHYWFISGKGIALFHISGKEVEKIKAYPLSLFENELIPREENIVPIGPRKAVLCLASGYAILDAEAPDKGDRISGEELKLREVFIIANSGKKTTLSPYQDKISIPHARNNLTVRYSIPLHAGESIKYQYKVEGLNKEWSTLSGQPAFEINRIPAGEYVIKVRAINKWEKFSAVHEIKLNVNPPWYQSTPAVIMYGLVFFGLFFLAKNITEKKVKLNEKHKREEKERELIRLRNDKLRSELSFKSRQLANSTLSIIKKNEFLMALKEKLKRHKEQLGTRYPDKYYHELIQKIDGNISGDDDWRVFEHNFNQAHETFLQNLKNNYPDLTPSDLRLCAFLRINLTSKEIAPLLGISVRGVENHRYRLRKKLNLSADTDLTDFILKVQNGESDLR